MMDYEPITKELREYIERHPTMMHAVGLTDLLDNIDAIQRSLEQENERLRNALARGDDWIKLPLDADGVPVCEGDELWSDGVRVKVKWLEYKNDKWAVFVENKVGICFYAIVEDMHHYRPDSWESIIEDAFYAGESGELDHGSYEQTFTTLVARCKTLAGVAE